MSEDDIPEGDAPEWIGMFDLSFISPEELAEMDEGRFLCVDCGEFYAPDGTDEHTDCPSPRNPGDYPPGLLS